MFIYHWLLTVITPVPRPAPPAQSSPQFPTQMMGPSTGGPPASMPPSGVMAPGGVPKCKIHTCNKPCYVEKGGRVHDFCGKSHADLYKKTMAQQAPMQAPQPVLHKQPVATTTALFSKPTSSSSTMMIISQRQQPPPGITIHGCVSNINISVWQLFYLIHRVCTSTYGNSSKY